MEAAIVLSGIRRELGGWINGAEVGGSIESDLYILGLDAVAKKNDG